MRDPGLGRSCLAMTLIIAIAIGGCRSASTETPLPGATEPAFASPTAPIQPTAPPLTPTSPAAEVQATTPAGGAPGAPTVAPAETSAIVTHTVEEGDTLGAIALQFNVTVEDLVTANKLESADFIRVGQTLTIPVQLTTPLTPVAATPAATALAGTATPVATTPVAATTPSLSPVSTLPPVNAELITNGSRANRYVALTFDACQTANNPAGYDAALIDVLIEKQAPATLFLGGLWIQSHPTQTQTLGANKLFELGNHSWSHLDFANLDAATMADEIVWTQKIMVELTGRQPTLFRLPFGTYTQAALEAIGQHGLRTIQWDVVTGDPDPNIGAASIVRTVLQEAQNGSIVIMHMNTRGWHTAEALPDLIDGLRDQGFQLVTVSQLLGLEPVPPP